MNNNFYNDDNCFNNYNNYYMQNEIFPICGKPKRFCQLDKTNNFNQSDSISVGPQGPIGETGPARSISNYADFYAIMPPNNSNCNYYNYFFKFNLKY